MDVHTFDRENSARIHAVESSFGASGKSLYKPGRVLIGEGRLLKLGRRKPQPKVFFLFNDVLVYGSIILNGRWHKNQKIIPLENIQLEDVTDSEKLKNQWLIRTPRKSFFVSAPSNEEKRAWIEHIEDYQSSLLQEHSCQPGSSFAVTWIPDQAASRCMRCFNRFTATRRRHHCRKCGFLVCNSCSKERAVIHHIHPTKKLRVCSLCHTRSKEDEISRLRGDSTGRGSSEEEDAASSDEEEGQKVTHSYAQSSWLVTRRGTYVYPKSMHLQSE